VSDGCGTIGGNLGFPVRDREVGMALLQMTTQQRMRYLVELARTGSEAEALKRTEAK
jgi:hypothetical protein